MELPTGADQCQSPQSQGLGPQRPAPGGPLASSTASKEGRAMNKDDAPPPAEAATEVGVDDDAVESLGTLVVLGLCVVVLVGLIAFVVGVLV
jgi:hypothetical protein